MSPTRWVLPLIICCLLSIPLKAFSKTTLAVLPFSSENLREGLSDSLSDDLIEALSINNQLLVQDAKLTQNSIAKLIQRQQIKSDCVVETCLTIIAQTLGVDKLISVQVSKINGSFQVSLDLFDQLTAKITNSTKFSCSCQESELKKRFEEAALALLDKELTPIQPEQTSELESLIKGLNDPSKSVRYIIAKSLGEIRDPRSIGPLIKALGDDYVYVREEAAHALGKIGEPAIKPLIETLQDENIHVRLGAAKALDYLKWQPEDMVDSIFYLLAKQEWNEAAAMGGTLMIEPLIEFLAEPDDDIQSAVADALGKMGLAAIQPLIQALKSNNSRIQTGATKALQKIGAPAAEPFVTALKDEDIEVRKYAASTLSKIGWEPKNNEERIFYLIAKQEWKAVIELGGRAAVTLIEALVNKNMEKQAATALRQIGEAAVDALIGALKNDSFEVRIKVTELLGKIKDTRAVEPLIQMAKSENADLKLKAIEALGRLGDSRAVQTLIDALKDKNIRIRVKAMNALGKIQR